MPQSKQTTLDADEDKATTGDGQEQKPVGEVVEWECPYCDQTREKSSEIRTHITTSTDDAHMGIDGWTITEDLVGRDENGRIARTIAGFTPTTDPDEQKEAGWKKKQVINAWLARPPKADVDAIDYATDASRTYAYRLLREIHNDDFEDYEIADLHDPELEESLGKKIDEFHETKKTTTMSTETQTEEEPTDVQIKEKDDGPVITVPSGEGKKYIANAALLAPEINYSDLEDVFSLSSEYCRRILKQIREGDISKEDVEGHYNEAIQRNLMDVLEIEGYLDDLDTEISDTYEGEQSGTEEDEEEWPEFDAPAKEVIINSYLLMQELGEEIKPKIVAEPAGCGYEYARRLLNELNDGKIPQHEINEAEADDMKNALHHTYAERGYLSAPEGADVDVDVEPSDEAQAELEYAVGHGADVVTEFDITADGTAIDCVSKKASGERCTITAQDNSHFCHIHRPDMEEEPEEEIEEAEDEADPGEEVELIEGVPKSEYPDVPASAQDALLYVYTFGLDLTNKQAANGAGCSQEYARQVSNKVESGELTVDGIEGELADETKSLIRERLELAGYLEEESEETTEEEATEEPVEEAPEQEPEPEPEEKDEDVQEEPPVAGESETPATAEVTSSSDAEEKLAEVAAEIDRIHGKADMLLRQAKFESDGANKKAEFIAQEMTDELNDLLEKAQ